MTEKPILKGNKSQSNNQGNRQKLTDRGKGQKNDHGGRANAENSPIPSPWLEHPLDPSPRPHPQASFVEYLRWMRSSNHPQKENTKIEIMTKVQNQQYSDRLKVLADRTKLLAGEGNWFIGECKGRIRVGGYRGVEAMLLPAVDALGIPFIPSSSLRGVARNAAIREFMNEGMTWTEAVESVAPYFGSLEATSKDQMGKVIFFDAYPCQNDGISIDIANNIWKWQDNNISPYSPNPNPFFSLENCSFIIGLKPLKPEYKAVSDRVKRWLTIGLAQGIGAQVNAGYGVITTNTKIDPFFSVEFAVRGQLIHGAPTFNQWRFNDRKRSWEANTTNRPEVRPIAFKSMLRYWFRGIALGVLPAREVKELEGELFGSISPQKYGLLCVRVKNAQLIRKEPRDRNDKNGEQEGILELYFTSELKSEKQESFVQVMKHLTWLMFHLGGIGQGSRRPLYSRRNRDHPPWWRGSNLVAFLNDDSTAEEEEFWDTPDDMRAFGRKFQQNLLAFYYALKSFANLPNNYHTNLQTNGEVRKDLWQEAIDRNCKILLCQGESRSNKPFALDILHSEEFKLKGDYNPDLCGKVRGPVKPSPIWISNPDRKYQVVTVFGAVAEPRRGFVEKLKGQGAIQIFPL